MRRFLYLIISILVILMVSFKPNLLIAQETAEKGHIELKCVAEKEIEIVNEKGESEVKRIEAKTVIPGDIVIYTISYTVVNDKTVEDVIIDNPIPQSMVYQKDTAYGYNTDVRFSIDGGKNYDSPEKLKVIDEEGNEKAAMASDYTNIQWTLKDPVKPGKTGWVAYKAQLK